MTHTFPHATPTELVTSMANSAKEVLSLTADSNTRHDTLRECFNQRIHELMHFRPHTVDTDGF